MLASWVHASPRSAKQHKAHSAAILGEQRHTAPCPSVASWQWGCGWEGKDEHPAQCPRSPKPPVKYSAMLPSTAAVPGARDACGHPGPSRGSKAPYGCSLQHGTSKPRRNLRAARFGGNPAHRSSQPKAGGELGCSPHALRKAAARREAGKGMCCPCCAWEYLLMPQECGYVMASPPHALPLPRGNPPARRAGEHPESGARGVNPNQRPPHVIGPRLGVIPVSV